jgi:hypothetical protein
MNRVAQLYPQALDSLFVASYDSQGYDGSIRPRLHTGLTILFKVKVTMRLTVSQSVSLGVVPHLGPMTRYLLLFDSYGLIFCGAPSLTRGRVCLSYMLLAIASAVFLGSQSLGTRYHILLSQI